MKRLYYPILFALIVSLVLSFGTNSAKAQDSDPNPTPDRLLDESLPGEPPFPVSNREMPYRIHNCPISQETVNDIDGQLKALDESRKTQGVIICMPYGEVNDGVMYAITFYNHMQLGYPDYAFRDRGFVWLVQVDSTHMKINYAVGEGLPLLDAAEIDTMRDEATSSYLDSGNLDASMLSLTKYFVDGVTDQYDAVTIAPVVPPQAATSPETPSTGGNELAGLCFVGLIFLVVFIVLALYLASRTSSGSRTTYYKDTDDDYTPPYSPPSRSEDHGPSYSPPSYTPPRSTYRPPSSSPSRPSSSPFRGSGGSNSRRGG